MNKKLIKIINGWNPVEIFPLLEDEYFSEIRQVDEIINSSNNLSVDTLSIQIDKIFIKAFGENIYKSNIEKCKEIAKSILE